MRTEVIQLLLKDKVQISHDVEQYSAASQLVFSLINKINSSQTLQWHADLCYHCRNNPTWCKVVQLTAFLWNLMWSYVVISGQVTPTTLPHCISHMYRQFFSNPALHIYVQGYSKGCYVLSYAFSTSISLSNCPELSSSSACLFVRPSRLVIWQQRVSSGLP